MKPTFGDSCAAARRHQGLKQNELARRLSRHPSLISRVESGQMSSELTIGRIGEALGLVPVLVFVHPSQAPGGGVQLEMFLQPFLTEGSA